MSLTKAPKRHRYPVSIISEVIWLYHRFNHSLRDVKEQMAYRGVEVSHETIREWNIKFGPYFREIIKKRERKPSDKWHLDEMVVKAGGEPFVLWRAVDSDGHELDVFLQKRRDKKAAIRFLSRLLGSYPEPRVIVTDKLRSYVKPIKCLLPSTDHRFVKKRTRPMLGFKNFQSAKETLSGIENIRMIQKGQMIGQKRNQCAFHNFSALMA